MNKAERDQMRMRLSDERTLDKKSRALFGLIILNVNVKCRHYYCTLVHGFLIGFFANGVELLQQNLLTNKSYYGFTAIEAPQYNSFLTIEDLIIKLLLTPLYGVYVDRYGRQKMILFGYVMIILSLVLFPIHYYSTFFSSLAWYFGVRFIYSNGSAILPIVPILADYVDNASKGKAIGISVLLMTLGASCSTLLVSILAEKNPFITYMVFTCLVAVLGIGYSLVLKPGNSYYKTPRVSCEVETSHHLMASFTGGAAIRNKRWEMVKKDCKSKPWILASYIFAFLNGTAMALVTQIMNLYVQSFGPGNEKLGSAIVLRANIASTIVSFVLGPTLDIMKPIYVAALVFIFGVGAYSSIGIVKDPQSIGLTIIAICIGVAYSCSLMLTKYLGFKNYRTSIRGILFSIANLLIMLGTTVVAVIGGNMFKSVGRNSPFYIGSGCAVICTVLFLWLYFKSIRPQEKLNRSTRGKVVSPMLPDNGQAAPFEMFLEEEDDLDGLDQEQNVPQDSAERTPAIKDNSSPGPNSENSREGLSPMKRTLE